MVVPDLTEKALLKGINIDTANVAANTAGILVEMKSQKKSENIFCKDKKLLGTYVSPAIHRTLQRKYI